jgi:DNA-binding response OmpR family regulator
MRGEIRTVLIAEDDDDILDLVSLHLDQAGYAVITVRDGQAAVSAAREYLPDLIVLDVVMPGLDGHQVLRRLRRDEATGKIPVILLTARAEPSAVRRGLAAGADDYIVKPFRSRELLSRIEAALARRTSVRGRRA